MVQFLSLVPLLLAALWSPVIALDAAGWSQRSIYFLLTDRFATTDGSAPDCWIRGYCGGTWRGIQNKLDYIQGMGFDAIWISPVVHQLEGNTPYGYAWHGYWQDNPFELNQHFGTAQDLKNLAAALHSRGMYLMVDVVLNHFASNSPSSQVNFNQYPSPFNSPSAFHSPCNIDYNNQRSVQNCWLVNSDAPCLPDVNSENANVYNTLVQSVVNLVRTYGIDGIRLDTARQIPIQSLAQFQNAVGVMVTGEVMDGDPNFVASYQGPLNSILNFPLYYPISPAFLAYTDFSPLATMMNRINSTFSNHNHLTTFVDNHDFPRMASMYGADVVREQNAAAFLMFTSGIPIFYYGFEQRFSGASDPANRETLWRPGYNGYNTNAGIYQYLAKLHRIRSFAAGNYGRNAYFSSSVRVLGTYPKTMAIQRGPLTVVVSNDGLMGGSITTLVGGTGYPGNANVIDLLTCNVARTDDQGRISSQSQGGQARIWMLQSAGHSFCGS